jgi:transposase
MPLSDHDKTLVEAMFRDDCDVNTVLKVVPHAARSTLYWMQRNFEAAGHVQKPSTAIKQRGRRRKLTPIVRQYAMELLAHRNDLWQEELAFELWCEFDVEVSKSTICRMLKEERLSSKVNTRIASRRSAVEQGVYEETLAQLMARSHEANIEASEMLLYLDESAASEKVMFRRRSWSAIGLPAYTRSELLSKVRCSVLPALDIHGYLPGATLVVEGAVTQAIYEHWLETVVLPQSEPYPGRRSIIIMDNCSTHHSDKVTTHSTCCIRTNANRSQRSVASLAYNCCIYRLIHHI